MRFQDLFHSPPGVLFTLPSRYSCAIGRQCVLSLTRWSSQIHAGFPGSRVTRVPTRRLIAFTYRAVTFCGPAFQAGSVSNQLDDSLEGLSPLQVGPTTPMQHRRQAVPLHRFRLFPFRSPLLRESHVAFSSSGYLDVSVHPVPFHCPMCSGRDDWA